MTDDLVEPPPRPSLLRTVFVGPAGIRAGWSISIFVICLGMMMALFIMPTKLLLEKTGYNIDRLGPVQTIAGEFAGFLGLLGASMVMALIERKPLISYGLEGRRRFSNFLWGMLWGFLSLSALLGVLLLSGFCGFDGQNIFGYEALVFGLAWGVAFLLVGLLEEYMMRGYLQATLARGIGFWWSAVILSAAFGAVHLGNQGESPVGIVAAALVGFVFCISLWYLKNLWWAIGFHCSWDWAESYFWGTANSGKVAEGHLFSVHPQGQALWSGGATGPEGSAFVLPLLLTIALLMWYVWGRSRRLASTVVREREGDLS
jgi:membrane protease YdiL (CAAX protease family)